MRRLLDTTLTWEPAYDGDQSAELRSLGFAALPLQALVSGVEEQTDDDAATVTSSEASPWNGELVSGLYISELERGGLLLREDEVKQLREQRMQKVTELRTFNDDAQKRRLENNGVMLAEDEQELDKRSKEIIEDGKALGARVPGAVSWSRRTRRSMSGSTRTAARSRSRSTGRRTWPAGHSPASTAHRPTSTPPSHGRPPTSGSSTAARGWTTTSTVSCPRARRAAGSSFPPTWPTRSSGRSGSCPAASRRWHGRSPRRVARRSTFLAT